VTVLLDANVLIALVVDNHVHHTAAENWLADSAATIATCPITQGSLVRLLLREGQSAQTAATVVAALMAQPRHEFWPDDAAFDAVSLTGVIGHRQVTDAYLAHLARGRGGRLATFDQGLAKLHGDVADLVPVR
jgi:toxin-antitoxin system PIN domain toxin